MMQIHYKFEKPRKLDTAFVTQTIFNNLRQIYGIIGMAKFEYEVVEMTEDKIKVQIEEELQQEFWVALMLGSQFGNVKYKCILIQ